MYAFGLWKQHVGRMAERQSMYHYFHSLYGEAVRHPTHLTAVPLPSLLYAHAFHARNSNRMRHPHEYGMFPMYFFVVT